MNRRHFLLQLFLGTVSTAHALDLKEDFVEIIPDLFQATTLVNMSVATLMAKNIPLEILRLAKGCLIIPKMVTGNLLLTASKGLGIIIIRENKAWYPPLIVTLVSVGAGITAGFKTGNKVLIFMNSTKLFHFLRGTPKIKLNWEIAVGPTQFKDYSHTVQKVDVYDYSQEIGLLLGIGLESMILQTASVYNEPFYGQPMELNKLLSDTVQPAPGIAQDAWAHLQRWLERNTLNEARS